MELDDQYWSRRYTEQQTGWDLHQASPPLKAYIDQWADKESRILIPGCGNAWEADYLLQQGFKHITLVDISCILVTQLKQQFKETSVQVVHTDFFKHQGRYDLILEQTFFCAIHPLLRTHYVEKMHDLLATGGTLAGVLFNRAFEGGPPFGGSISEYQKLFLQKFELRTMNNCYNSIVPRANTEVFFIAKKAAIPAGLP